MFKTRGISIDAARPRIRRKRLAPKKVESIDEGRIAIHTMPVRAGFRKIPDEYKTLERPRRTGWGFLVFLGLVLIAAVSAFYYWDNRPVPFQGDSVDMQVTAPAEVVSGEAVTFVVEYRNRDVVALKHVELDVQWPDGFYYNAASVSPISDRATTWILGPLEPDQGEQVEITGQLVGTKGQVQQAVFRLSYRPANFNSDFEVVETIDVLIADARLDVTLTSPTKVLAGQEVSFEAVVTNLTSEKITSIDIEVIPPKDFDVTAQDPKLADNHWKGDLSVSEPLKLTTKAKVVDDAAGEQAWVVEVNEIAEEQVRKLLRKELSVTPVKPDVTVELKVNGQSSDFEIDYGETLNYQLTIKNVSNSMLNDIKVTVLMDSDVIDRRTVQTNGFTSNESIVWTKEHVEKLAGLNSDEDVVISWKADLLAKGTVGRATVDNVITIELEGLAGWQKRSPVFIISVGEGLVFNQGLYWDLGGSQVGSGNLPPVTNERTVYLIVWSIDSGAQDYDTVTVSTFLPTKVSFVSAEEVDEGSLKFDEETRRLEWQINNFSSKLLPLKATFYVKLVPLDEDKGTVMTVLNPAAIVASGRETFESKSFQLTTANVIISMPEQGVDYGTVLE